MRTELLSEGVGQGFENQLNRGWEGVDEGNKNFMFLLVRKTGR